MEKIYRILVINPGSTSTKIAVFDNEKEVFSRTLRHSTEELQPYKQVADQFGFRKQLIVDALLEANIDIQSLSAVIGRGGLVKPIPSGVYEVNETLKHDLIHAPQGEHASNLGGLLAVILMHSTGAIPHGGEIDVPLTYADYYFVEALHRYNKLLNNEPLF